MDINPTDHRPNCADISRATQILAFGGTRDDVWNEFVRDVRLSIPQLNALIVCATVWQKVDNLSI